MFDMKTKMVLAAAAALLVLAIWLVCRPVSGDPVKIQAEWEELQQRARARPAS